MTYNTPKIMVFHEIIHIKCEISFSHKELYNENK